MSAWFVWAETGIDVLHGSPVRESISGSTGGCGNGSGPDANGLGIPGTEKRKLKGKVISIVKSVFVDIVNAEKKRKKRYVELDDVRPTRVNVGTGPRPLQPSIVHNAGCTLCGSARDSFLFEVSNILFLASATHHLLSIFYILYAYGSLLLGGYHFSKILHRFLWIIPMSLRRHGSASVENHL